MDDGRGIDVSRARGGSGIQNMADRMAALAGTFDLRAEPGGGTRVSGRVPAVRTGAEPARTQGTRPDRAH